MASGNCVLCGAPVRSKGEHVFPTWFLKRYDGQGPFTISVGGKPVAKRNGKVERDQMSRVMLPVCGSDSRNDCNKRLNDVFENPGKPQVRAVLDDLQPITGSEVLPFVRWVAKTLVLHAHPLARDSEIGLLNIEGRRPLVLPESLLRTMRDTAMLPDDLSLWMGVVDPDGAPVAMPEFEPIHLPDVDRPDGVGGESGGTLLGFSLPGDKQVLFQLLFHPLCDVSNPFESAGLMTRLWPAPPAVLDITALPVLDEEAGSIMGQWVVTGGISISLQPGERWPDCATMKAFSALS
ncbi:hypothetical protein ACFWP2_38515 [Kitasatospora sp. NPDC058444]|uniref:hypothetical protein n=1 Tax=Kitasatospora sp. NPDC058444 TaxID=3346504 RepID=UPI00364B36F3